MWYSDLNDGQILELVLMETGVSQSLCKPPN
nr:MAG TPA: hypothetical protein [Caudoviricetes sp.]